VATIYPFVRHGKISTWARFLGKIERHATWGVTKSTATSSISRLKAKLAFSSKEEEKEEFDQEEGDVDENLGKEDTRKTMMLLGKK